MTKKFAKTNIFYHVKIRKILHLLYGLIYLNSWKVKSETEEWKLLQRQQTKPLDYLWAQQEKY